MDEFTDKEIGRGRFAQKRGSLKISNHKKDIVYQFWNAFDKSLANQHTYVYICTCVLFFSYLFVLVLTRALNPDYRRWGKTWLANQIRKE